MTPKRFRDRVLAYYAKEGRTHLPWRKTKDPYRILVSEIMLQQTQVDRVIPYYERFLETFPTVADLARAPLATVLRHWQGLGYNRRAKMLHEAAKMIVASYQEKVPRDVETLESLPGIGPYTARAVAAFAYNQDVVFVETNLRTAVLHHFFTDQEKVHDNEILLVLKKAYPEGQSRRWYAALMDYGAHLKRSGVKTNVRSAHYKKQSGFKGSAREVRGAIIKALAKEDRSARYLSGILGSDRVPEVKAQLQKLMSEGLVRRKQTRYSLAA